MSELALLALDHTKTDVDRELYNLEYESYLVIVDFSA